MDQHRALTIVEEEIERQRVLESANETLESCVLSIEDVLEMLGARIKNRVTKECVETNEASVVFNESLGGGPFDRNSPEYTRQLETRVLQLEQACQQTGPFRSRPDPNGTRSERGAWLELEVERLIEEVARLSRDPLTGAWGRGRLKDLLGLALARSRRRLEAFSAPRRTLDTNGAREVIEGDRRAPGVAGVLMIDVDGLKPVNDHQGHPAGDRVLAAVAQAIHSCLRAPDSLIRYGGDEFVVVIDEATGCGLEALGQRIANAVTSRTEVRVSIGCALLRDDDNAPALIKRADDACYIAKRHGGDQVAW